MRVSTSLPLVDYLWAGVIAPRLYRAEKEGRFLYRVSHVVVPSDDGPVMKLAFAGLTDRVCDGCGAITREAKRDSCALCGGTLRRPGGVL